MYVPSHFEPPSEQEVLDLLDQRGAADLITVTDSGLVATLLPFLHDATASNQPGVLRGHVARNNDQWSRPAHGEALVIVRGPDAYVSPAWYPSKAAHGRVVPTWNYIAAHVYGELLVHDDLAWVEQVVRELTDRHEEGAPSPWSVDDAPPAFISGQLRAIVGIELRITRVEAKFKLSQNRSAADVAGVINALSNDSVVEAMRAVAGQEVLDAADER